MAIKYLHGEMKNQFYNMNKITHCFSFKEDGQYVLYLGNNNLQGFKECTFSRLKDLRQFVSAHCGELIFYRGNH